MDKITINSINKFVSEAIKANPNIINAFLFGSFAKNQEQADSDIDIAFIVENLLDDARFDLQVQLLLLASKYDTRIEPHPLSKEDFISNNPFVLEIKKTGLEIEV